MNNSAPVAPESNTVSVNQPQQTAPGMNPPHGQPNHRCDIPVGAPLNSKNEKSAVKKARAVYDWVIANSYRDENIKGCGIGHPDKMLEQLS